MKDLARTVEMMCPTCGSKQFEYDENAPLEPVRCVSCDRVLTRDELQAGNAELVQTTLTEMGKEATQQVADELRKAMRNAFRGSKNIKIK